MRIPAQQSLGNYKNSGKESSLAAWWTYGFLGILSGKDLTSFLLTRPFFRQPIYSFDPNHFPCRIRQSHSVAGKTRPRLTTFEPETWQIWFDPHLALGFFVWVLFMFGAPVGKFEFWIPKDEHNYGLRLSGITPEPICQHYLWNSLLVIRFDQLQPDGDFDATVPECNSQVRESP